MRTLEHIHTGYIVRKVLLVLLTVTALLKLYKGVSPFRGVGMQQFSAMK